MSLKLDNLLKSLQHFDSKDYELKAASTSEREYSLAKSALACLKICEVHEFINENCDDEDIKTAVDTGFEIAISVLQDLESHIIL